MKHKPTFARLYCAEQEPLQVLRPQRWLSAQETRWFGQGQPTTLRVTACLSKITVNCVAITIHRVFLQLSCRAMQRKHTSIVCGGEFIPS